MTEPNFFIIGAMKSGTTVLYDVLNQHPYIYMSPVKEPNFLAFIGCKEPVYVEGEVVNILDWDSYHQLFNKSTNQKAIGEASHSYLYFPQACNNILETYPHARLIAILRNPVQRAFSHYLFLRRDEKEVIRDFSEALKVEEQRLRENYLFGHYVQRGLYFNQLQRYFESFSKDQILVLLYEDYLSDPLSVSRQIYRFLKVDDTFTPDPSIRRNPSGLPKNRILHNLLTRRNFIKSFVQPLLPASLYKLGTSLRDKNLKKPEFPQESRSYLMNCFREDIIRLQDLIDRDLSEWVMGQ